MLKQRIITALVLIPIVLAGVFLLPAKGFALFVAALILIAAWEWSNLSGLTGYGQFIYPLCLMVLMVPAWLTPPLYILVAAVIWWGFAFYLVVTYDGVARKYMTRPVKSLIGLFILIPAWVSLVYLQSRPDGHYLILLLFLLIWGADTGAYFAGRAFGQRKLAPKVSPGKSWAGVVGGMLTAVLIAVFMSLWAGKPIFMSIQWVTFITGCLIVAGISVLGDLTESMFKRDKGIKDSSGLLPGHGGVLDRIDSLVAAGPLFALMLLVFA